MGKKRVEDKKENKGNTATKTEAGAVVVKAPKNKLTSGVLHVQSTYNNLLINLTDKSGNSIMHSSSGAMGFKGAKKGTPFAASKVAGLLADKAKEIGVSDVDVVLKGVGAGREAAIRAFSAKGISISMIRDITPVPHNGPKARKPRRV